MFALRLLDGVPESVQKELYGRNYKEPGLKRMERWSRWSDHHQAMCNVLNEILVRMTRSQKFRVIVAAHLVEFAEHVAADSAEETHHLIRQWLQSLACRFVFGLYDCTIWLVLAIMP